MYAPTWEGENDANNYTSVDRFGPQIVEAVLRIPGARLIYKPHPRVETSKDPEMVEANARILELIEAANSPIVDETLQHQVLMQGDILGMFDTVDLLITDISSVGLDFLYLHPNKPLVLTDRRNDSETLNAEAPISRATPLINESTIDRVESLISEMLNHDSSVEVRHELRRHYFGDGEPGSSSVLFTEAVSRLIADRTVALESFHTESVNAETDDE